MTDDREERIAEFQRRSAAAQADAPGAAGEDSKAWLREIQGKIDRGEMPTVEQSEEPEQEAVAAVGLWPPHWPERPSTWPERFIRQAMALDLRRYLRELAELYNGTLSRNQFFRDALNAWGQRGNDHDGIVLFGGEGTGKSVTALALCLQVARKGQDFDFLDAGEFADLWAAQDMESKARIKHLKSCGLLVVDEIGDAMDIKGPAFGLMKRVINARYRNDLPVILATVDGEEDARRAIGPELLDRFPTDMQIGTNEGSCRP